MCTAPLAVNGAGDSASGVALRKQRIDSGRPRDVILKGFNRRGRRIFSEDPDARRVPNRRLLGTQQALDYTHVGIMSPSQC